jgi:hypothetical protein
VTDGNGNTTTGTIYVDIVDDVPMPVLPAAITVINSPSAPVTASLDPDLSNNYGADGGTVRFSPSLDGTDSLLTSSFLPIIYNVIDPQTLIGYTSVDGVRATIFTITLDTTTSQFTVDMQDRIDSKVVIDFNNGAYNFTGGNNSWTGFVPVGEVLGSNSIDNNSLDLLLTPAENSANAGSVNTTATIGGVSGGASVGAGETFRVDFVKDLGGDPADTVGGLNYASIQNRDHTFDGHYVVNGATALFKSSTNSTIRITAFDDPDLNAVVGDGLKDVISGITISYFGVAGGLIVPTLVATNYTVNAHVFTVVLNADGSVSVSGVAGDSGSSLQGTVIAVFTANGYNSLEYTYQAGDTFQIGDFGATATSAQPVSFAVPVEVIDADGDISSSSDLVITANPPLAISLVAPITLDASHDGQITYQALATSSAHFDYARDGFAEQTAWIAAGDALLVYDHNSDRVANDGSEIAFIQYHPDATSDLEGLRLFFDSNYDGVFDVNDARFVDFGIWTDFNADAKTDAGEFQTLMEADITSINLTSDGQVVMAADGDVLVHGSTTYSYADGTMGLAQDVTFTALLASSGSASEPTPGSGSEPVYPVVESIESAIDTFAQSVVVPEEDAIEADSIDVADLLDQFMVGNTVRDSTIVEYQQEFMLTAEDSIDDVNLDPCFTDPTAEAIAALDEADFIASDDAAAGLDHAADVVDDFSYTV